MKNINEKKKVCFLSFSIFFNQKNQKQRTNLKTKKNLLRKK